MIAIVGVKIATQIKSKDSIYSRIISSHQKHGSCKLISPESEVDRLLLVLDFFRTK